ncbi:MAG: hypothetical protein P1P65_08905 [Treponema sp.]
MRHYSTKAGTILFFTFFLFSCSQYDYTSLVYTPAKLSIGYLYEYHSDSNLADPSQFTAGKERTFIYLQNPTVYEKISCINGRYLEGFLFFSTRIMDWNMMRPQEIRSEAFLRKDAAIHHLDGTYARVIERYDFQNRRVVIETYRITADKKETFTKPVREKQTLPFDPEKEELFFISGDFPAQLFLLAPFFDRAKQSIFKMQINGYVQMMQFTPQQQDFFSYNGQHIACLPFHVTAAGLMGRIFSKSLSFWVADEPQGRYLVRFRNENWPFNEYRLARRTAMKPDEWEAFKQKIKDEFSPEGYVEIDYEE